MTSFADLPDELVSKVTEYLRLRGTWRALDEVVRDHAALSVAGKCMRPVALVLADDIREALDLSSRSMESGHVHVQRPTVPPPLDDLEPLACADPETVRMRDARAAIKRCGEKCARTKVETLERVRRAVSARPGEIEACTARQRAFDSHPQPDPVPCSPVPAKARKRCLDPQRMSAKGARARFLLTERDLASLPSELRKNPYYSSAAPMRLYRVSDLRVAATSKYGGLEHVADRTRARHVRAQRMSDAIASATRRRRETLEDALRERGCSLRDDSRLCSTYIATGRGDPERIADTMAEMAFVHAHTRYREILDENIQQMYNIGEPYDIDEESYDARTQAIREFIELGENLHLLPHHLQRSQANVQ